MPDYTKDEVYNEVRNSLVELFELEESEVTPGAKLLQDLGLDSIDAIDLIVRLKNHTGIKVKPDDFKTVRTVDDVVQTVYQLITRNND